jgi:hypothetical protein
MLPAGFLSGKHPACETSVNPAGGVTIVIVALRRDIRRCVTGRAIHAFCADP